MTSISIGVPHGGVVRALALHSKGQWFDPRRWQLEKVVYLDENSWTHTNLKDFVQMAERLEPLSGKNECCSAPSPRSNPFTTYVKDILSGSTKNTVTEI